MNRTVRIIISLAWVVLSIMLVHYRLGNHTIDPWLIVGTAMLFHYLLGFFDDIIGRLDESKELIIALMIFILFGLIFEGIFQILPKTDIHAVVSKTTIYTSGRRVYTGGYHAWLSYLCFCMEFIFFILAIRILICFIPKYKY